MIQVMLLKSLVQVSLHTCIIIVHSEYLKKKVGLYKNIELEIQTQMLMMPFEIGMDDKNSREEHWK